MASADLVCEKHMIFMWLVFLFNVIHLVIIELVWAAAHLGAQDDTTFLFFNEGDTILRFIRVTFGSSVQTGVS